MKPNPQFAAVFASHVDQVVTGDVDVIEISRPLADLLRVDPVPARYIAADFVKALRSSEQPEPVSVPGLALLFEIND